MSDCFMQLFLQTKCNMVFPYHCFVYLQDSSSKPSLFSSSCFWIFIQIAPKSTTEICPISYQWTSTSGISIYSMAFIQWLYIHKCKVNQKNTHFLVGYCSLAEICCAIQILQGIFTRGSFWGTFTNMLKSHLSDMIPYTQCMVSQWSHIWDVFWTKIFLGNWWQLKCLERWMAS